MKKKAQTLLEYALVIACVAAALMAMQFYVKRAVQGRLRTAADQIGEQYEPGDVTGGFTVTVDRDITTNVEPEQELIIEGEDGYATLRTDTFTKDEFERTGTETLGAFGSSLWE
ncbi:MAG: hypothetical protein JSV30_06195 [Candidatus Omnitrophota bacterium]|nr:MAG: hypothetical protein JSV30_06195 [Candidatus Omnitrophota bacterium]